MFANTKTTEHNQWTRHVLKTVGQTKPVPRCAFLSFKQKKSLEDLFQTLDAVMDGKDASSSKVKTVQFKGTQEPELQEQGSPSTRIPRLHRKRPSLEIPTDLAASSPRVKRRRAMASAPAQKVQKGDTVKVVQGAKKKFLGLTGTVERFLFQKRKWGLVLENGSRIALGDDCLELVEAKPRTSAAKVPALQRAKTTAKCGSPEEAKHAEPKLMRARSSINSLASLGSLSSGGSSSLNMAPRGSTSMALPCIPDLQSILPASEEELVRFTESFPKECRPKNAIQVMIAACVTGRQDVIVSLVVNSKVDVNADHYSAHEGLLHVTIANDQPEICLLLMEMGIEVDHQDAKGCSPLMLASKRGMASVVAALCLAGANVNQANKRKQTPLMVAAMYGHLEIIDILLENDADVNMQDDMSQSALTMGMSSDDAAHKQVVDRLVQRMYVNHSKNQQKPNGGGL